MKIALAILYILLCLGSFLLTAHGVKQFVPWPEAGDLQAKVAYFEEHKDEYDALFFGSSKVFRAIIPQLLEERLAEQGISMRSFNFGCPGMYTFEADYLLKEVLALQPKNLEYVFLEWVNWNPRIKPEDAYTMRTVHWHSTEQTLYVLKSLFASSRPLLMKLDMAIEHVGHWIWKQFSYGRGLEAAALLLTPYVTPVDVQYLAEQDGYIALEDERDDPGILKRRNYFVSQQQNYLNMVRNLRQNNRRRGTAAGIHEEALARQIALIRAAGAEPIFIDIPGELETPAPVPMLQQEGIRTAFGFNRLRAYPQFFLPENHFDSNHLSREGAEIYTKILAEALAKLLGKEKSE